MVGGKEDLMNAVALNSSIFNGARVAGPAIGALALAWQGPGLAFLLNGFSYAAVLVGLFKMKLPPFTKPVEKDGGKGKIVEGLNYVRRDDTIGVLMALVAAVSIFAFPYATLMPIFADDVLHVGKEGYGVLMAVTGIGSLIGALSLAVKSGRAQARRGRIIFLGAVGLPLVLAAFSLSTNYALSLAALLVVGWAMISINATINTVIQTNVPDELRGRVNGVYALLFIGVAPLGNLQAGIVADHFGAPAAVFIGALMSGLVVLYILVRKRHVFSME
jgi:predicted MFS family arabinose efflux permease